MTLSLLRIHLVATLCASLVGCGGGDDTASQVSSDPPADGGDASLEASFRDRQEPTEGATTETPKTTRSACRAYMKAWCERYSACNPSFPIVACDSIGGQCPDRLFAPGSTRTIESAFACADAFATLSCSDLFLGKYPPCATSGARKAGESCMFAAQCDSLVCGYAFGAGPMCSICTRVVNAGEQCGEGLSCPLGYRCQGYCEPAMYVAPGELHGPCSVVSACARGLFCRLNDSGLDGVCEEELAPGSPCTFQSSSDAPVICAGGYCDADGTCHAWPNVGDPCGTVADHLWPACGVDTYCGEDRASPTARCLASPGLGDPCKWACKRGLECSGSDGGVGSGVCIGTAEEGESCTDPHLRCASGTDCVAGRCVARATLGLFDQCAADGG
jgi:hypothetical protein